MSIFIISNGISACLKAWILRLGHQRKVLAEFRWFFLYVAYSFIELAARVSVSSNRRSYFYVYWATEAVDIVFLGLAFAESFFRTLRPFAAFKRVRWAFGICVVTPVLYSVIRAILEPPAETPPLIQVLIGMEITADYLVIAMTVLYLATVHLFNVRDDHYERGIIWGFGFNSGISAFGFLLRSILGTKLLSVTNGLPALAFLIAEAFWVATLRRRPARREEPTAVSLTPDEIIRVLDEYLEVLRGLFRIRWFS